MLRLFLLILGMFPFFLLAQTSIPSSGRVLSKTLEQPTLERLLRIGLTFKVDQIPDFDHRWVGNDLVPWRARQPLFAAVLNWQPIRKVPHLLLALETGFQKDRITTTSNQVKAFQPNLITANFRESIEYHRWQLAPGIRIDILPQYALSPFVSSKLLLAIPSRLTYRFESTVGTNLPAPHQVDISGGAEVSPGWEFSAGLRLRLAEVFHFSLAFYHMELDQKVDWPPLDFRYLGDTILTYKNRGLLMSLQYEL